MKWEVEALNSLAMIVYLKYNTQFWGRLEEWKGYLSSVGIERRPWRLPRSGGPVRVFIECPWSVGNSVPGQVYTKWNLYIPEDLAEKIVVLGAMPSPSSSVRPGAS